MRYVYGKHKLNKEDFDIHTAVPILWVVLVDSGSSAAYGMRNDLVTPMDAEAKTVGSIE